MNKLLLIDGHSIMNRAFYGLPDLTTTDGLHTNAILGFLNIIFKIMEEEQPDHVCVAFDVNQPTFRHEKYGAYKGTRKPMPTELREQIPVIKDVLTSMQICICERGGYEADDILGTLSRMGEKEGLAVTILSGDRDLLQLATDTIQVRIPKTNRGGTVIEDYYAKDVQERYLCTPMEFIDLKGLMGDTSDNIPGVPGIGEKTAMKIIADYHSIEEAYAHIDEIKPPKAQKNLAEFYDQALMSKDLATIKLDCELPITLADCVKKDLFQENSYALIKRLELKSLYHYYSGVSVKKEYKPDGIWIQDLASAKAIFQKAESAENCAFCSDVYLGRLRAICLGIGEEELYYMEPGEGESVKDLFAELISLIRVRAEHKLLTTTLDYKMQLHMFSQLLSCEMLFDEPVLDLGIACYLLNPTKETYQHDDIARDILDLVVPSKDETQELPLFDLYSVGTYKYYLDCKIGTLFLAGIEVLKRLQDKGMEELYWEIECPMIYSLYDMERYGIKVREEELKNYGDQLVGRIRELEDAIHAAAGEDFNILSPKQLGTILFEKLQLPGAKKTKTGYSTNVEVLEKIKNEHPIVADVLEYRQLTKLKSTYADGLANYIDSDGRIHSTFLQTKTATGRISSMEPNLQNIPIRMPLGRMIRKVFVPEDGYIFVDADYSQIELRVLTHLSKDPVLKEAFCEDMDIHASTAAKVFHVPMEEVTPLMRRQAKAVNFGIIYGISAHGLSQDLDISRKEAQAFIDAYFATYPAIREYLDSEVEAAKETGVSRTLFKRVRPIPELKSGNFITRNFGERVAMNSPIQGTAADIIKIATNRVRGRIRKEGLESKLILQIHDELLVEAKESEKELIRTILEEEMMQAANLCVPLSVDIHEGVNWYEAK